MDPLDETAVITVKQDTAAVGVQVLNQLSSAGADVSSAVGSWITCDDVDPRFGQYVITAKVTVPVGDPVAQLDPLVNFLESDGWTAKRETAQLGNALADLRKTEYLVQLTTTGAVDVANGILGPCIESEVIGTEGYDFSVDKDQIPLR